MGALAGLVAPPEAAETQRAGVVTTDLRELLARGESTAADNLLRIWRESGYSMEDRRVRRAARRFRKIRKARARQRLGG